MTINRLFTWFIGSFVGAALFQWFQFHWAIGASVGAVTGVALTLWREILALIDASLLFLCRLPFEVIGLIEGAIERNKAEPQRRVLALEQLLFWIPLAHCVAWVVFVVLRMIAIGDSKMIPVSYLTTVGVLLIPIVYAIGAIINPEAADKYTEPEDKLKKLKHRALLFNFATAPFTLTFLAVRALVRKVRRTDLSDKWTKLIRAFHSKSALPAGIFCAIGALVGCIFHNPWIGGFAGMGVGYLEYFLVRRFAPWAFYPAN